MRFSCVSGICFFDSFLCKLVPCWFLFVFFFLVVFMSVVLLLQNAQIGYLYDLFTDRELELRELRKVVLSSQEENISLNKEMEDLKVNLPECVNLQLFHVDCRHSAWSYMSIVDRPPWTLDIYFLLYLPPRKLGFIAGGEKYLKQYDFANKVLLLLLMMRAKLGRVQKIYASPE